MERPGKRPGRQQQHPDCQSQHAPSAHQSSLGQKVKESNWRGEADSKEAVQSWSWAQAAKRCDLFTACSCADHTAACQRIRRREGGFRFWTRVRREAACCRDADSQVEEKGAVGIAPAADDGGAPAAVSWRMKYVHDDGSHINHMEDSHTLNTGPRSDLFRDQWVCTCSGGNILDYFTFTGWNWTKAHLIKVDLNHVGINTRLKGVNYTQKRHQITL